MQAGLKTIKPEHRMHAMKNRVENKDRRVHRGQTMEGLECHAKELELDLQGSKDLSRTIPRKAMINTRQEVKTLQCISALHPHFLALIIFERLWKDRRDL